MNISKESKDKLRSVIASDILFHETELKRLRSDLISLDVTDGMATGIPSKAFPKQKDSTKTFSETIKDILSDGMPRTSRELLIEFNKIKGKSYVMVDFSARLSPLAKPKTIINVHKIDGAKLEVKNWYGLVEWFEGDVLKQQYLDKIKKENE